MLLLMTGQMVVLLLLTFNYSTLFIIRAGLTARPGANNKPFFDILTQRIIAKEPLRYRP